MGDGTTDKLKGHAKEAGGDLTGDKDLKNEGKVDRASGKVEGRRRRRRRQGQGRRRQGPRIAAAGHGDLDLQGRDHPVHPVGHLVRAEPERPRDLALGRAVERHAEDRQVVRGQAAFASSSSSRDSGGMTRSPRATCGSRRRARSRARPCSPRRRRPRASRGSPATRRRTRCRAAPGRRHRALDPPAELQTVGGRHVVVEDDDVGLGAVQRRPQLLLATPRSRAGRGRARRAARRSGRRAEPGGRRRAGCGSCGGLRGVVEGNIEVTTVPRPSGPRARSRSAPIVPARLRIEGRPCDPGRSASGSPMPSSRTTIEARARSALSSTSMRVAPLWRTALVSASAAMR